MLKIADHQRALIFQGGGALGAYEAGVYKGLCEWLSRLDKKNERGRPLFDIIAGTSIGSINAAILVSYVKENKTFEGSAEKLIDFWEYLSTESSIDNNPILLNWWNYFSAMNNNSASIESFRRYYSTKEFIFTGVPNVFRSPKPQLDFKFWDPSNILFQCDNNPLKKSLEKFARFPIATSFDYNEPRLILLSLDVQEGLPVVFDSYEGDDGERKSKYFTYKKNTRSKEQYKHEYIIKYDRGIESDFVMASSSYPINFPYTELMVEESVTNNNLLKEDDNAHPKAKKIKKYFWDGGIKANTPLKEVILLHNNYWTRVKKSSIPSLRICIVNLHPQSHESVPFDLDNMIDRKNDLTFHDKTKFDEKTALLISDYIDLARYAIHLAEKNGISRDLIDFLLEHKTRSSTFLDNELLTFGDLIREKANIEFIIRIERKNDSHTVSNKIFDFSVKTIDQLINDGYTETIEQSTDIEKEFQRQQEEFAKREEEFAKREEEFLRRLSQQRKQMDV